MARVIKIDNALKKKFSKKSSIKKGKDLVAYFLIVCEGEKTEPNYFKGFPKKIGKVIFEIEYGGGGISTIKVVEKAIELREKSSQKYDRVWAVFDRDSFKSNSFNSAIKKATSNDIKCAWSNEAFELWYLLHFHNRTTAMSRDEYKLAIESAIENKMAEGGKKGKKKPFSYKKNDPNMWSVLNKYGNQENAIKWAKKLNENFEDEKFAEHNPSTQVYLLVEELIGKSKSLKLEIEEKYLRGE